MCGWRAEDRACGMREAAVLGDGHESAQDIEIEQRQRVVERGIHDRPQSFNISE
jgi:hypothetical protein